MASLIFQLKSVENFTDVKLNKCSEEEVQAPSKQTVAADTPGRITSSVEVSSYSAYVIF